MEIERGGVAELVFGEHLHLHLSKMNVGQLNPLAVF